MSEPLFICGNQYLGFRDDVPRGCQGCARLRVMQRSAVITWKMPCQSYRDMMHPPVKEADDA